MILKRIKIVEGPGITFGDSLAQVGKEILGSKFRGVYDEADPIPELKPGQGVLINKPRNQHWIAQYRSKGGVLYTYDSYGRSMGPNPVPKKQIPKYFIQQDPYKDCGSRSLAYLFHKLM